MEAVSGNKRPLSNGLLSRVKTNKPVIEKDALCSFCGNVPAAVLVEMPSTRKRKEAPKPFCLLHYYTTRAIRVDPSKVSVSNQNQIDYQLENGGIQELFAEAFTELQQELGHECARAFQKHKSDPLAVLHDIRGKPKKRPNAPSLMQSKNKSLKEPLNKDAAGGFMRNVNVPERMRRHQEQQQQLQAQQVARMQEANSTGNPYKRRKGARMSIWNMAMNNDVKTAPGVPSPSEGHNVTCSCGSKKVTIFGNITGRNSDMAKGETWGNKDRADSVIIRYQCEKCGKIWNEEV